LGISSEFRPKFVKRYVNLREVMGQAVKEFISEVKEGRFPEEIHSFK
jgi:3-methyl-2-oxobutanoate hydroxymethyltransferase